MRSELKTPLYANCVMLAPDGRMLCRLSVKRMNWYLNRGLASQVGEDPPTIKLSFEPSGRGDEGDSYLLSERENRCVVCGTLNNLTRHHVVPYCFRIYFQEKSKKHNSYDVLPVCTQCHDDYELAARQLRLRLMEEFEITEAATTRLDLGALKAATALTKYSEQMPESRRQELLDVLKGHYGKSEISADDIAAAAKLVPEFVHSDSVHVSRRIVEAQADINEFARRWRTHFLDEAKPRFLPASWVPDRKIY